MTSASPQQSQLDASKVEECALKVVNAIQRCIHAIRSINEFDPAISIAKRNKAVDDILPSLQDVQLFTQLESEGIVEEVTNVQALVGSSLSIPTNSQQQHISTSTNPQNERFKLVNRILLPLATSLASCYAILDALPATVPQAPAAKASSKGRSKTKPPPPRGLLSIQNYTDIAALLELLVCTSILPNVQEHVLTPAEERVRHVLPKSLAGRIPRLSLLWGCAVQNSLRTESSCTTEEDVSSVVLELQRTVQAMGCVILLDRFRPMLLPRHLADLYAAMFQAEAFESQWNQRRNSSTAPIATSAEYRKIRTTLLPEDNGSSLFCQGATTTCPPPVDAYSQARAYQTLLLRGTKAPLWLRQRVSKLLTEMACRDLITIVQVFVYAASAASADGDMTAASMRLARALTAGQSLAATTSQRGESANNYHVLLCQQLLHLLDVEEKTRVDKMAALDPRQMAGILTVWAVLDQLPLSVLFKHMLPLLSEGLFPTLDKGSDDRTSFLVHRTVKRIGTLLAFAPSTCNTSKVCQLFLCPVLPPKDESTVVSNGIVSTVFGQLLRIASIQSVVTSVVKDEALWCLRLVVHTITQTTFQPAGGTKTDVVVVEGTEMAAMALVYSVAATEWDMQGYQFRLSSKLPNGTSSGNSLDRVGVEHNNEVINDIRLITDGVERRAKIVINDLIVPLSQNETEEPSSQVDTRGEATKDEESNLPSTMFHLLLLVYFSTASLATRNPTEEHVFSEFPSQLPVVLRRNLSSLTLAVMMLLPLLCEQCAPTSLLLGDEKGSGDGGGVLGIIKMILDCASSSFGGIGLLSLEKNGNDLQEGRGRLEKQSEMGIHPFARCGIVFEEILALGVERDMRNDGVDNDGGRDLDAATGNETLLSTSSLVLSMLIAMLELGSERRSNEEEELLTSIMPSLRSLAEYTETDMSHGTDASQSIARAELAEMASHAMALISCRSVASVPAEAETFAKHESSGELDWTSTIEQAEKDLQSDQPPIRARGIVSLRHLARGYLEKETARRSRDHKPLIEEISEGTSYAGDNDLDYAIMQILRVSVMSLADSESYVYLAGIQTIVAAGDVCPREVVPSIGRAVSTGVITFKHGSSIEYGEDEDLRLPSGQRVKLAEALLFTIRRRGSAIFAYVPYLMDLMVTGCKETDASIAKAQYTIDVEGLEAMVQRQTKLFFQNENDRHESLSGALDEDMREERRIRMSTGGPVFDIEEDDVVRSACISVISELISVSHPPLVARYCPALIRLVTNALRLDVSRPIRRAAALLCRELYRGVLREHDEALRLAQLNEDVPEGLSLAVEMVSSGEDALFSTLQRCVAVDDVDQNDKSTGTVIKGKTRVYDPATVSRCHEAVGDRESAEQEGIFAAATLIAKATELEEKDPVARMVRARLKGNTEGDGDDVVHAMKGLRVDPDSLRLL